MQACHKYRDAYLDTRLVTAAANAEHKTAEAHGSRGRQ